MRTALLATAFGAVLASPAAASEWTMASGYPESNFLTQNIRLFIGDVEKATNGSLKITLHSNDTLIKLDGIRRALQVGQVQIGEIRMGVYSNEDAMYTLEGLPFIAGSYDDAWKLMQAQAPYFDQMYDKLGLKILAYQPWPGQGFYTKDPVNSTKDFEGKKLRIYSKPTQQMGEMLGFQATILPFAEIPQAFATGLIEALFTSPQTGIDIQAWDNTEYFTLVGAMYSKNAIVVNKEAFEALPADVQAKLVDAGRAATKRAWEMSAATLKAQMQVLADNGMTVKEAPPQVIDEMKKVGEAMMATWKEKATPDQLKVLESYQKSTM
jgi:TRAP-type C4-dicarboxylate transport system substrate-binding protein